MALKRKITKAEHDALNPAIQAEYKAEGADFILDATGYEDPGELRRALERVREEKATAETKVIELSTKLDTITATDARRAGDITTLEKSWQAKVDAEKTAAAAALANKDKFIKESLVDNVAIAMASELAGENATILLPHIRQRLSADLSGEKPLTRILDKEGKPSAFSVEDLKKEIQNDKQFAAVVVQSHGSGGGAAGRRGNGGAGAPGGKKFHELSNDERVAWYKSDPQAFKQASDEANKPAYA